MKNRYLCKKIPQNQLIPHNSTLSAHPYRCLTKGERGEEERRDIKSLEGIDKLLYSSGSSQRSKGKKIEILGTEMSYLKCCEAK